jgi:hypothetical protein
MTTPYHTPQKVYLECDGEASVPHTIPLNVGQVEWRVQWLSAFWHATDEVLVLFVQVQESTCSVSLLLCCHVLFEPEASDAGDGGGLGSHD